MMRPADASATQPSSVLGRTSPLVKLGLAFAWLLGLTTTVDPRPGLALAAVALAAGLALGSIRPMSLLRVLAPALGAIVGICVANFVFAASNANPAATEIARIGPLRLTSEAGAVAIGIAARIAAIVSVGAVFVLTTSTTQFVDALVQQGRLSPRFGYGANAAYQAVPNLASDFATVRAARRLRGLRSWHPRVLVSLLVRAIRHADQLALAMDARAFGSGPRTTFRPMRWAALDAVVAAVGLATLVLALALAR